MATEVGKGYVSISADQKGLQNQLGGMGAALGAKFGPIGEKIGALFGQRLGTGITSEVGGAKSSLGGLAGMLGDAGPWGIAAGAAVASAAAIGVGLYKLGDAFAVQYRTIARSTGATGNNLKALDASFRDVASHSAASFGQVTTAITEVQRYTGPTGKGLDALSTQFLNLSRITGTDVAGNVQAGVHALENWNIAQKDAPKAMNQLFTASQKSGESFADLAGTVTRFGPAMRTVGYSFSDTTAMAASFAKTGVNSSRVMTALQTGASKLAKANTTSAADVAKAQDKLNAANLRMLTATGKQIPAAQKAQEKATLELLAAQKAQTTVSGKTIPQAMAEQIASIKNAKNETDALGIATQLFGSRGATQMVDAIRNGRFNLDEMSKSLKDSGDSINGTAQRTQTLTGAFGKMKNSAAVALEPLATKVFSGISNGLIGVMSAVTPLLNSLGNNMPQILATIGRIAGPYIRVIGDQFKLIVPIVKVFGDTIGLVADLLEGKWGAAFHTAGALLRSFLDVLKGFGTELLDLVLAPFRALGIDVPQALAGFFADVAAIPGKVFGYLAGLGAQVWNAIATGFSTAVGAAEAGISGLWGWVLNVPNRVFAFFAGLGASVFNAFVGGLRWAVGGAEAGIAGLWGWVAGIGGRVIAFFGGLGGAVFGAMASGFSQAVAGASAGLSGLWGLVSGIGGRIRGALGDLGGILVGAGEHVIDGLVSGIRSGIGKIGGVMGDVASKIKSFLPFSPAKEGPLSGAGDPMYAGISIANKVATGLSAGTPTVNAAMNDMLTLPSSNAPVNAVPGFGGAGAGTYGGPAVVIQNATFTDEADIETFMRKAAWVVQTQRI